MSNSNTPRPDYVDEDEDEDDDDDVITEVREVHALNSPHPTSSTSTSSHQIAPRSSSLQSSSSSGSENLPSLSREFNAMVVAGSNIPTSSDEHNSTTTQDLESAANLERIREEELLEETNPLAIVPDNNPVPSPRRANNMNMGPSTSSLTDNSGRSIDTSVEEVSVHKVKKEEVETKISAWQTAEIAKINNRFKRQDVIISGWESEQIEKSTAWLKKVERKLEEQRARAEEKMKNDVAKARRKAEEKRASAEAKRGTKVAKVLELSSLLRTVGRAPSKRSIF